MKKSAADEAKRWLAQAGEDFKSADILVANRRFDVACFLFQQSAEKALKAFLYAQGEPFPVGHSVTELAKSCARYDREFSPLASEVSGLDAYYIPTRYPNGLPDSIPAEVYNSTEAERAKGMAEKVIRLVKSKIKI